MPVSRQLKYLRAKDLAQLRAVVGDLPLVVMFDPARRTFACHHADAPWPAEPLFRGRYQVLHAFLSGYVAGWAGGWAAAAEHELG